MVVQHWFVVLDVQNLKKSECSTSHLLFSFWNFEFFCGVDGQEPSPCSQSPQFDLKEINHFLSLSVGSHLSISSILPQSNRMREEMQSQELHFIKSMFAKSITTSQCSTRLAMGSCQEESAVCQMVLLELKRSLIGSQLKGNHNYLYRLVFRRSVGWLLRSLIIFKIALRIINEYLWSTYLFWCFMVIEKIVV